MAKSGLNIENYNNDFLIITSDDRNLLAEAGKSIFEQKLDFIDEVIVAEMEVCVKLNHRFDNSKITLLNQLNSKDSVARRDYKLPVYFSDSEDWKTVEECTRLNKSDIISKMIATELSVALFGFLPGFVYLDGLGSELHVPRKTTPSKYVKANSIAIGGKYLGIYSIDSPGGWHVIGKVPTSVLDLQSLPPVTFNIGDTIQLESISEKQYDTIVAEGISFKTFNS